MKRRRMLVAMLICTAVTVGVNLSANAETYENLTGVNGSAKNNTVASSIADGVFKNNTASNSGGAIYTSAALNISNSTFTSNAAQGEGGGGAIKVETDKVNTELITIDNSEFTLNTSANYGGAIDFRHGELKITNSKFLNNSAALSGAIVQRVNAKFLTIENSKFENNSAGQAGGALGLFNDAKISNTQFIGNKITADPDNKEGGGAIFMGSVSNVAAIENVLFENNSSVTTGGAIGMRDPNQGDNSAASLEISGAIFKNNTANGNGGAIFNTFADTTIKNSEFVGNSGFNGGAIYNEKSGIYTAVPAGLTIEDVNFTDNKALGRGGAIFANGDVTVNAKNSNVTFSGNSDVSGSNDIVMNANNSTLSFNAAGEKSISIDGGIKAGENASSYVIDINGSALGSESAVGRIIFSNTVSDAAISVNSGVLELSKVSNVAGSTVDVDTGATLDTMNNLVESIGDNITLQDGAIINVDIDTQSGEGDNFSGADIQGSVVVNEINTIGGQTNSTELGTFNIAEALGLTNTNVSISQAAMDATYSVMTPIRRMEGMLDSNGMMTFAPTGNGYKDFNPAIMASPVAAQLGGYLTQLNSYDQAFRNMDMYMLMTKKQREALKLRNKYAVSDSNLIFGSARNNDKSAWVRPYATFENVSLKGGPKVSNVAYGSFFGGDSELYDLGNGWDGMFGVYVGYNSSHQSYSGISTYQNGGTLGMVGMAYKGNFFAGLTMNTGANAGEASTAYGRDNFTMLMAGVAGKTGYNVELADGKFIIQPSLTMSYSFVNTFDYTNAAGVRISSDPLNAIQIEPGVRFIGNLKNGWQPYAGVSVVWNIMDKTDFRANSVSLPEVSVKPYVRYGVGVRKTWGERLSGFLQAFITNGGRNGVGLQAGFRISIGKDPSKSVNTVNKTPELPKTRIVLSSLSMK